MQTTEYRVIGPPGTGKTTYLARQTERAAKVHTGTKIYIASLTRTAAQEIADRVKGNIPKNNVGTLHSLAYRALERPDLTIKHVNEWNEWIKQKGKPHYRLTSSEDMDIDKAISNTTSEGDSIKMNIGKYRARMIDFDKWNLKAKDWFREWKEWKDELDLMDFTDLIEVALETVDLLPHDPDVFFLDEAQDMDKLELTLARKWGEECIKFIVVGDPLQNLYEWRGSDPDVFYYPELPDDQYMLLSRSYRLPSKVLKFATNFISQLDKEIAEYKPDYKGGEIKILNNTYRHPQGAINKAVEWIKQKNSVMYLTSCSYMLKQAISECMERGIPFHNPYRVKRGDWNPIKISKNSTANILFSFYKPLVDNRPYTYDELYKWLGTLNSRKTSLFTGTKKHIKQMQDEMGDKELQDYVDWADVYSFFENDKIKEIVQKSPRNALQWYIENMTAQKRRVAKKLSKMMLSDFDVFSPKFIIGTIHSVKGGQADRVIIAPDLSRKFTLQLMQDNSQIVRMYYVAITRAKKGVYVMLPDSNKYVDLERYIIKTKRELK